MDFEYYIKYFAMLEERLKNIEKYIAFEEENLNVFSIECASIINDCCGLINGFCYELCKIEKPKRNRFEINDYKKYIYDNFQIEELVRFDKFILQPWERIITYPVEKNLSNPLWWDAYNKIKHSGKTHFINATLRNAISCMAGMFALLLMYDYKQFGYTMCNWDGLFSTAGNYRVSVSWEC